MAHVVWLINNLTHYHRARADAFAKFWPGKFTLLELSNKDALAALQSKARGIAPKTTLFPGVGIEQIEKSTLRKSMLRFLDEASPDVCCLNGWALPGTAAMLHWAAQNAVPCVMMSETNEHDSKNIWWKEQIKRRFVAHCEAALVGGAWHRAYLMKLGMPCESIFDGYDVVDNEHFRAGAEHARQSPTNARAALGLPLDYFLACARFEPKKNLRRLIEAYNLYVRAAGDNPWNLVIVGDGPLRAELEVVARDLGLTNSVLFKGLATYEELPGIYGLANVFVHASTTEQWGLVVNEAMAAGLPLLASERCGCVSELVKDGVNGFTFNPWKIDEIAEKMLIMHQNSSHRREMGLESAAIINDWGPERFARNLQQAIQLAVDCAPRKQKPLSAAVVRLMALH